jgi:hypothetical protein
LISILLLIYYNKKKRGLGGKGKERRGKEKGRLIVCKMCNGGGGPEN